MLAALATYLYRLCCERFGVWTTHAVIAYQQNVINVNYLDTF